MLWPHSLGKYTRKHEIETPLKTVTKNPTKIVTVRFAFLFEILSLNFRNFMRKTHTFFLFLLTANVAIYGLKCFHLENFIFHFMQCLLSKCRKDVCFVHSQCFLYTHRWRWCGMVCRQKKRKAISFQVKKLLF